MRRPKHLLLPLILCALFLAACGGGGGGGGGSGNESQPQLLQTSIDSATSRLSSGGVVVLTNNNGQFPHAGAAKIDDEIDAVTTMFGDQIIVSIPELSNGVHTLTLYMGNESTNVSFESYSETLPADLNAYTNNKISELKSQLENIDELKGTELLNSMLQNLDNIVSNFNSLSSVEQLTVARFLQNSIVTEESVVRSHGYESGSCLAIIRSLIKGNSAVAVGAGAIAVSLLAVSGGVAPLAAASLGVGIGMLYIGRNTVEEAYEDLIGASCFDHYVSVLLPEIFTERTVRSSHSENSAPFIFYDNRSAQLDLKGIAYFGEKVERIIVNVKASLSSVAAIIDKVIAKFGGDENTSVAKQAIAKMFDKLLSYKFIPDGSLYSLAVDSDVISGTLSGSPGKINLTFSYVGEPLSADTKKLPLKFQIADNTGSEHTLQSHSFIAEFKPEPMFEISSISFSHDPAPEPHECCKFVKFEVTFKANFPIPCDTSNLLFRGTSTFSPAKGEAYVNFYGSSCGTFNYGNGGGCLSGDEYTGSVKWGASIHHGGEAGPGFKEDSATIQVYVQAREPLSGIEISSGPLTVTIPL